MEKVEIKLSEFGLEGSDRRRYFIRRDGKVEIIKMMQDGSEKAEIKVPAINNGYPVLWVWKTQKGQRTSIYVRDMVAIAFHDYDKNDENQRIINIDFDKVNNNVDNIKVVTPEEWKAHYMQSFSKMKGVDRSTNPPGSKISIKDAKKIKSYLQSGKMKVRDIAKEFNLSQGQIYRIKRGENWAKL